MKLLGRVGKNCPNPKTMDVLVVQTALQAIKNSKFKPYYGGKVDGICGKKTIAGIEDFQCDNFGPGRNQITGRFEPGGPWTNHLKFKTPQSVKAKLTKATAPITGAAFNSAPAAVQDDPALMRASIAESSKASLLTLPRLEKGDLVNLFKEVYIYFKVVVKLQAHGVTNDGRFFVNLSYGPGFPTTEPNKRETIAGVRKYITNTFKHWTLSGTGKIELKSVKQFVPLKGTNILSDSNLAEMNFVGKKPTDPVQKAVLASIYKAGRTGKGLKELSVLDGLGKINTDILPFFKDEISTTMKQKIETRVVAMNLENFGKTVDFCGVPEKTDWVPDTISGLDLREACIKHDKGYETKGRLKTVSDAKFLKDLLVIGDKWTNQANSGSEKVARHIASAIVAWTYFYFVYSFGHFAYRDAQKQQESVFDQS